MSVEERAAALYANALNDAKPQLLERDEARVDVSALKEELLVLVRILQEQHDAKRLKIDGHVVGIEMRLSQDPGSRWIARLSLRFTWERPQRRKEKRKT